MYIKVFAVLQTRARWRWVRSRLTVTSRRSYVASPAISRKSCLKQSGHQRPSNVPTPPLSLVRLHTCSQYIVTLMTFCIVFYEIESYTKLSLFVHDYSPFRLRCQSEQTVHVVQCLQVLLNQFRLKIYLAIQQLSLLL